MAGMMLLGFLFPLLAAAFYVVVFQKAGFRGPILLAAAGLLLSVILVRVVPMSFDSLGFGLVMLLSGFLSLLPLAVLALLKWPPVAVPGGRP